MLKLKMSSNIKQAIYDLIKSAGGKWVNLDEICQHETVRLNRKDVSNLIGYQIKSGNWPDIKRSNKRGKNLATTLIGRPVYHIKYRLVEEC